MFGRDSIVAVIGNADDIGLGYANLIIKCPGCNKHKHLNVEVAAFEAWSSGFCLIQDAFPWMLASQRELLITGICNNCWEAWFNQ